MYQYDIQGGVLLEIGIGVWAFVVYLAVVIVWNAVVKRSITEAMLLGFLVAAAFGGIDNYITTVVEAFCAAATGRNFRGHYDVRLYVGHHDKNRDYR